MSGRCIGADEAVRLTIVSGATCNEDVATFVRWMHAVHLQETSATVQWTIDGKMLEEKLHACKTAEVYLPA